MNDGYIKIQRKILKWQWYRDINTFYVFITLLLDANYEDRKVGFETIKRGQCLTSYKRLSELTNLSIREIRTALGKLEKSGEIDKQTTSKYSIITIRNYSKYQDIDKQATSKRQASDNIKEIKENKEYKENISKDIQKKYFESIKVNNLFIEFLEMRKKLKAVNSERAINSLISKLKNFDEETQCQMIENSIVNSWKGIFELKTNKERKDNVMDTLIKMYNEQ